MSQGDDKSEAEQTDAPEELGWDEVEEDLPEGPKRKKHTGTVVMAGTKAKASEGPALPAPAGPLAVPLSPAAPPVAPRRTEASGAVAGPLPPPRPPPKRSAQTSSDPSLQATDASPLPPPASQPKPAVEGQSTRPPRDESGGGALPPPRPPRPPRGSTKIGGRLATQTLGTGTQTTTRTTTTVTPPPVVPRVATAEEQRDVPETPEAMLAAELRQRSERLRDSDPTGAARTLVELGVLQERVMLDRASARRSYEKARRLVRMLEPAVTRMRRLIEGKVELPLSLELLEDTLRLSEGDGLRADLLAERARTCDALGRATDGCEAFAEALRLVPMHAASLRGLEVVLRREVAAGDNSLAKELATHLERLADAYAPGRDRPDGDARLAAWIQVERASVLDSKLNQPELALAALEAAVGFDAEPGPVRNAMRRHLIRHHGTVGLVSALSIEADHESDDDRASRLLYTGARLLLDKLRSPTDAVSILSRAMARAPTSSPTRRRILAELIRLLEMSGAMEAAASVRQQQLVFIADNDAIVHEHVRLSEIYDAFGNAEQAAMYAAQALERDPTDASTRERLDRALQRLGHHEERVRTWSSVANSEKNTAVRVAALLRAADISERHLHRREDAIAYLRAAWTIDPGNSMVFDVLSALISPKPLALDEGGSINMPPEDPRGVRARIDLYTQAATAAQDPARRVGLLEKLVSIWEDELGQPNRAIDVIEKILEIDPRRRTAILALERNAARAGDFPRLLRALTSEAEYTSDRALERKLLLRAAEISSDRLGDRDRASTLISRALSLDPKDVDALRARFRIDEKAGRYDEARSSLLKIIAREAGSESAFSLWIEVALLDERRLKRPQAAVDAYREAARIKPHHPLPRTEIARLLREIGDYEKLVEVLTSLAQNNSDPNDYARLLFQAAEVQEFALGRDQDALQSLTQADLALMNASNPDPAILEAMERIYIRKDAGASAVGLVPKGQAPSAAATELASLYTQWLERQPIPPVDHALRISLSQVLATSEPDQAIELLQGLLNVVPDHVPTLRLLEQLHRHLESPATLVAILNAEADVVASSVARIGALWEIATLEEQVGATTTLEALERIVRNAPKDVAALLSIVRIASKLTGSIATAHPALTAPRGLLVDSIRALKELTADPITRALYNLEEGLLIESQSENDVSAARAALGCFRSAIALWPESLLAARGLDRLGQRLGDRSSVIQAQIALSKLAHEIPARAGHLVRAAELTAEDPSPEIQARALDLYNDALQLDPDCTLAADALSRILANDPARLVDRLNSALEKASVPEAIVLLGTEIGRSVLKHQGHVTTPEPGIAIAAMRRVLEITPDDPAALLLMARLLIAQRVWAEARDILLRTVAAASDLETKITAHFFLADLHEGPLANLVRAQEALDSILALEPANRLALERLHKIGVTRGDHAVAIRALSRIVELASEPLARADAALRLADAYRDAGDGPGLLRAYCDAIVSAPNDNRAWSAMARLYRTETPEGAANYSKALLQLIELATARRLPVEPRWLITLGLLEINVLVRSRDGIAHLQQATLLPGSPPEARSALGRGLEAAGRNAEAVQLLRDVLSADAEVFARLPDLPQALSSLEAALAKDGRSEERLAVEEVRACLGDVAPDRIARLRHRRLPQDVPHPGSLAGSELGRVLLPEARVPMIEVAMAIAPILAKAIRFELGNLGIGSRERISPRDGHLTRLLAERIGRTLGVETFELYLAPSWQGAARVYPGDPPAIIAATSFAELPELEQTFALARLLSRIALGFTFLDEIPIDAADGLLLAAARIVDPGFGSGELSPARDHSIQQMLPSVQKAMGRRQRKMLEEIVPKLNVSYDARSFTIGLRRSEYRIGYIVAGDVISPIDYLRRFDREIGRSTEEPRVLLQHPVTNELMRYALTGDAYTERRRTGAVWSNV